MPSDTAAKTPLLIPRVHPVSESFCSVPLLPVHQPHGLEAAAVFDLSWDWLRALDAALGHVEGNVHTRRDGAGQQANDKLPQELQGGILAGERKNEMKGILKTKTKDIFATAASVDMSPKYGYSISLSCVLYICIPHALFYWKHFWRGRLVKNVAMYSIKT